MKSVTPAIIALLAAAAMPVLAAEQAAPVAPPPQIADRGDFASRTAEYEARARHEMDIWQRRMSGAGAQAQETLDRAWTATNQQWAGLQQASADGWDRSRAAFERAAERMKEEWHKYHADDQ